MSPSDSTIIFEALIAPHRSLGARGMLISVGLVLVLTTTVAVRFWLLGAWPVAAFSFLEAPLFILLLAINRRQARISELITLDTHEVTVVRGHPNGRKELLSLGSAWLSVDLESGRSRPRIVFRNRARSVEVGAFLHDQDRVALFEEISNALRLARSPRFNNPQLSDP